MVIALAGTDLDLVVDLGHQRAHGVDHEPPPARAAATTSGAEPWAESMSGAPVGDLVDVVDEDHAEVGEALHHEPVVDDLVVAVDGRLEGPHHPGQGLDGHLHPGAEASGAGQEHLLDVHASQGNVAHGQAEL